MSTIKKRETELDILRFLAMLCVIAMHVCSGPMKVIPTKSFDFIAMNSLSTVITWCIPVFVMISGGLFLNPQKEITIKRLFTKHIKHFAVVFLVWSVIYQIYYYLFGMLNGGEVLNWKGILYEVAVGPYHMWYLYMLTGVYLTIPILRKITESKSITEYFIVIFLIFSFLQGYGVHIPIIGDAVSEIMDKTCLPIGAMYIGYFILGFYIKNFNISRKIEYALYISAALILIINCSVFYVYVINDIEGIWSVKYLMPNIVIESVAIYTFFVKRVGKINFSERTVRIFSRLSEYGFGVYLVHALVNELVEFTGWTAVTISPLVSVPLLTLVVYGGSLLVTVVIRKIPFVGKNIT